MANKLAYSIHGLRDPKTGERRNFEAGEDLPAEYKDQIPEESRDRLFGSEPASEPGVAVSGVQVDAEGNEVTPDRGGANEVNADATPGAKRGRRSSSDG